MMVARARLNFTLDSVSSVLSPIHGNVLRGGKFFGTRPLLAAGARMYILVPGGPFSS